MQCPDCGREVDDLVAGSCPRCAADRLDIVKVPEDVPVVRCAHCGRYEDSGGWADPSGDREEDLLERARRVIQVPNDLTDVQLELGPHWQDERHLHVDVVVEGSFHGEPVAGAGETVVHVRNGVCGECSRRAGGYFEAIIQVRGHPDRPLTDVDELEEQVRAELDRLAGRQGAFFSKIDQVRGGLDFYVGSTEVARVLSRELVNRWGATHQETAKLVGKTSDGEDMFRVTMLVRMPAYGRGDFVRLDDTVYKVVDVAKKTLRLLSLEDWSVSRQEPARIGEVKVVGRREEEQEAVVVSQQGQEAQILDPVSLKTVDVRMPRPLELGETAHVFRYDERIWVVPRPGET